MAQGRQQQRQGNDGRERQRSNRHFAVREDRGVERVELDVVRENGREAVLILHLSRPGRGGGPLGNREIGFAVNGSDWVVPTGRPPWKTKANGRFQYTIDLKDGENLIEGWDITRPDLRVAASLFIPEEKKLTPAEKVVKRLNAQLEQKKLQKQIDAADKIPSVQEESLHQKELEIKIAKVERELAEANARPTPDEEAVKLFKLQLERAKAAKDLAELSKVPDPDEQAAKKKRLELETARLEKEIAELKKTLTPEDMTLATEKIRLERAKTSQEFTKIQKEQFALPFEIFVRHLGGNGDYRLSISVVTEDGHSVEGARVRGADRQGTIVVDEYTNAKGFIDPMPTVHFTDPKHVFHFEIPGSEVEKTVTLHGPHMTLSSSTGAWLFFLVGLGIIVFLSLYIIVPSWLPQQ